MADNVYTTTTKERGCSCGIDKCSCGKKPKKSSGKKAKMKK